MADRRVADLGWKLSDAEVGRFGRDLGGFERRLGGFLAGLIDLADMTKDLNSFPMSNLTHFLCIHVVFTIGECSANADYSRPSF